MNIKDLDSDELKNLRIALITAIYTDDALADLFTLKGGSAIDLIHDQNQGRSSKDIDLSMRDDFADEDELNEITERIKAALQAGLPALGYEVKNFLLKKKPKKAAIGQDVKGYEAVFQVKIKGKPGQIDRFNFDISHTDIWDEGIKQYIEIPNTDTLVIVYSRQAMVCEKMRAICQKLRRDEPRSKDFFDIYQLCQASDVDWRSDQFASWLKQCFAMKEDAHLERLHEIADSFDLQASDFASVEETVYGDALDFKVYFDFVVFIVEHLKERGHI